MLETLTNAINAIGLIVFVVLTTLAVARMMWRLALYHSLGRKPNIILKRDFALLGAFLVVFGELVALRAFGVELEPNGLPRLLYTIQSYVIALSAIAFWVKVEYFDVDDPRKP